MSDALVFNAGTGGDGNGGNAGKGGNISAVAIANSDVNVLEINGGVKANGGDSVNGRGGAGGAITGVVVLDSDANATRGGLNLMNIRTGAGGDGDKGGGNGGPLANFSIVGVNIEPTIQTGEGGAATLNGKGGSGGSIKSLEVAITGDVKKLIGGVPTDVSASTFVSAGFGGDGAGISGGGGVGGSVSSASINTPGFGSVVAGEGGSGPGARATAGRGGNIVSAGVFAGEGEGELIAGDAGAVGIRPAAGGSISGTAAQPSGLFAERSLTIRAGDGAGGGAGGSISFLGYGSTAATLVPTPNGNILVKAGDGSASPDGKSVGKGGSISTVSGAVNIGLGDTVIRAGDGGAALKKGAAGGSITNLSLQRGGELGVDFTIRAGDGGDAPLASTGAKGGSVSVVNIVEISTDAILRHIAAGDGGDALKVGGAGGSVSKINVLAHDIGVRDGEVYGFNTMGGIFAGAGGAGAKEGATGSVSVINADTIATIAAGRGATPKLATKVDNIYVNAGNLLKDSTHAFLESIPGSQQVYEFGGVSITATEKTPGSGVSGEVQTVDIGSVRALPAGTQFTLSFQGEKTAALDKDATAVQIAAALNALGTVRATGPGNTGTVTISGSDPVFDITFVQNGDQTVLIMGGVDSQKTTPLPLNATPAEVDAALDALPFINAVGGVTVTASLPSGYKITFNNPSDRPQVIGQEVFGIASTDIQAGVGNNNSLVPVTESVVATNEVHTFLPIAPFKFSVTYTEGAVTSSTVQLAATATADDVRLALEALPTIDPGDISVTKRLAPAAPNGTFDVRFLDAVDHPTLQVTLFAEPLTVTEAQPGAFEYIAKEKQIIHVDRMGGGVVTFAFGLDSFQLNLATGFTVAQLSNQLNLQPSIIAQGGVVVTETPANSKNFQVEFGKAGDQPSIRVQEDAFPLGYTEVLLQGSAAAKETLLFTHQTGSQIRFGYQNAVTSFITPNAVGVFTAAAIDTALETLPGIGLNGVTVLADADNSFKITFSEMVIEPI